jgi:dihydroorotate dehydrogenase electron transfer subunit
MSLLVATVLDNDPVLPGTCLLRLQTPELARTGRPGQFVMVRCAEEGALDPLLRRPLALHRLDRSQGLVELLVRVVGRGTAWLAVRRPGDPLDVFGPLGRGFELAHRARNLLLVAGGMGIAPLLAAADEGLARGCAVALVLGARTRGELYPPDRIPPQVEVHIATDDGSCGRPCLATDLVADSATGLLPWADQVLACGPRPMLAALADVIRAGRLRPRPGFAQVSLEASMACGVGACLGCVVRTRKGWQRVCQEGPVFDLREVVWE